MGERLETQPLDALVLEPDQTLVLRVPLHLGPREIDEINSQLPNHLKHRVLVINRDVEVAAVIDGACPDTTATRQNLTGC